VSELQVVRGGRALLDGISLDVQAGELVIVVGPNGAGKSTLIGAIFGWIAIDGGVIQCEGKRVADLSGGERASRLGWLPQRASLAEPTPVIEQVMAARFRIRESRGQRRQHAQQALERVGLSHLAERNGTSLSGGEAQRVSLAALIAQEARTWLLDEPANHLDPKVQTELMETVLGEWRAGKTVVLVTHDPDRVLARVTEGPARVVGLCEGRVTFDLSAAADTLADALSDLYDVPVTAITVAGRRRFLFGVQA
jgi:iron complex transport system ATP-binding protein